MVLVARRLGSMAWAAVGCQLYAWATAACACEICGVDGVPTMPETDEFVDYLPGGRRLSHSRRGRW